MSSRLPSKRSAQRCAPVAASMSWPVMRTRCAGLAHAALEHVAHAELAADLLHVDGPALVGEARVAGDHEQPADARQRGDDVLDDAVGEVLLLRVAAHVLERQHGDRRLVGKRRAVRAIDETDQAVAAPRHGDQMALPALVLVERLAERRDLHLEVVLLDHQPRPDPRQKLVLADDISPGRGQHRQDVQGPAAQPDRQPITRQLAPPEVEPEPAESLPPRRSSNEPVLAANSEHLSS